MTRKHNRPQDDVTSEVNCGVELSCKIRLDVYAGQEAIVESCADLVVVRAGDGQAGDTGRGGRDGRVANEG